MAVRTHIVCVVLAACLGMAAAQGCKSYANLGGWCQDSSGNCCGGAPKNAKCVNYVCASTAPGAGSPPPAPAATGCQKFANLGGWCDDKSGNCCGGAPKNAKCVNSVCTSTAPSPGQTPTPPLHPHLPPLVVVAARVMHLLDRSVMTRLACAVVEAPRIPPARMLCVSPMYQEASAGCSECCKLCWRPGN